MGKRLAPIALVVGMFTLVVAPAAASPPGQNPHAAFDTITCDGVDVDVAIVGIPRAAGGSAAAGRPGIAFAPTGVQVPKAISVEVYVNDMLVFTDSKAWGHGVTGLVTCLQTLEFTDEEGNAVRVELAIELMNAPRG